MCAPHGRTTDKRPQATSKTKVERIAFRVSNEQHDLLAEASRVEGRTLSAFILDAATRHAEDVLADRSLFRLPHEQWLAFTAVLDRPVTPKPRLVASLRRPTVFDDNGQ